MTFRRALAVRRASLKAMPRLLLAVVLSTVALGVAGAAPAFAEAPAWHISSEVVPTYLPPGGEGQIIVAASNLGDAPINGGTGSPVTITSKLPAGLKATAIAGSLEHGGISVTCSVATLQCTDKGVLNPYERLAVTINVKVEEPSGTVTSLPYEVSVEGGDTPKAESRQQVTVNGEATPFGVQARSYELGPFNDDGTPATQAGSHPFQLTTTLVMNQIVQNGGRQPIALPEDLRFNLPPGLIGNPTTASQCTMTNFAALVLETDLCPPDSVVGVATVTVFEPLVKVVTLTVPVFNLVPAQGEPARFGFEAIGKVPIVIDTSVRSGSDYGVVASVNNTTQVAGLLSSQVTLWGVPGDPRHDSSRGWECVAGGFFAPEIGNRACPASSEESENPFLTLPTSCAVDPAKEPFRSSAEADSWAQPGNFLTAEYDWLNASGEDVGLEGCGKLPFSPSVGVVPEKHAASVPSGVSVRVRVPQGPTLEANPEGLAEADVKDTSLTLPAGVQVSPSAANGLQACSEAQVGFESIDATTGTQLFTAGGASCPDASKLGVVHVKTPLLAHELEGGLYLAEPAPNGEAGRNPFDSLVAVYLVAEDPVSGVLVKLAGEGKLDPGTGQVTTVFKDTPQVPFEELRADLFGGPRASFSTPAHCGGVSASGVLTPWSGTTPVNVSSPASEFDVSEGCGSSPLAFSPVFDAQAANTQAGGFSPFELELARPDGQQALTGLSVHLVAGMAALLSTVTPCQEPPVGQAWACGPESLIGHSTAQSGLGGEPVVLGGDAYLTTGYDGAPFGVLDATEAKAGPFDLGMVDVRSRINVNPETAAVTITTDPGPRGEALPSMLKGIPVQLKRLNVIVDRPGFEFNPSNCSPMSITGSLSGSEGAAVPVSSPFQVGGCEGLPFKPALTATAAGKGSKAEGTSFDVNVTSAGLGQANIAKVDLQLPVALSSRLSTLQLACLEGVFAANPASCPEGSVIGNATVHTPVLKSALSGPAYLVSHGGAAFPDVEFVLQGEGITLVLDGKTDIKAGVTYSKFESAPDAPFTTFETLLPAGPHSIFTPNVPQSDEFSLCKSTLSMPTRITGQNGAVIEQNTPIAVTGCSGVLPSKTVKLTKAQLLAKALKACRAKYKHKKTKRLACEKQAHKKYGPAKKKPAHKASKTRPHKKSA